jgi:hypothetical protein
LRPRLRAVTLARGDAGREGHGYRAGTEQGEKAREGSQRRCRIGAAGSRPGRVLPVQARVLSLQSCAGNGACTRAVARWREESGHPSVTQKRVGMALIQRISYEKGFGAGSWEGWTGPWRDEATQTLWELSTSHTTGPTTRRTGRDGQQGPGRTGRSDQRGQGSRSATGRRRLPHGRVAVAHAGCPGVRTVGRGTAHLL